MAKLMPGAMPADNYQAQDDARTLVSAHKIKADPKRHKAAKAHAASQVAALNAVAAPEPMKGTK